MYIEVAQTNLIGSVHPSKSFSWDILEVDANVAIFYFNLVRQADNIKFLWDNSVEVNEGFSNPEQ
jgi:hypothetical protein